MNKGYVDADLVLHVLERTAFFTAARAVEKSDTVKIGYCGRDPVTLRVNGRSYKFEDGYVCTRRLAEGANVCEVFIGDQLIPCEGLILKGGYILPAGITDKAWALNIHALCVALAERNVELEREVIALTEKAEDFTDDIFDIG